MTNSRRINSSFKTLTVKANVFWFNSFFGEKKSYLILSFTKMLFLNYLCPTLILHVLVVPLSKSTLPIVGGRYEGRFVKLHPKYSTSSHLFNLRPRLTGQTKRYWIYSFSISLFRRQPKWSDTFTHINFSRCQQVKLFVNSPSCLRPSKRNPRMLPGWKLYIELCFQEEEKIVWTNPVSKKKMLFLTTNASKGMN